MADKKTYLSKLKFENNIFYNMKEDDDSIPINEELKDLKKVMTTRKIQVVSEFIMFLAFMASFLFPPLFLLWIWRWIKAHNQRDLRWTILVFDDDKVSNQRIYLFHQEDKNIIYPIVENWKSIIKNTDLDIYVNFNKFDKLSISNLDRHTYE